MANTSNTSGFNIPEIIQSLPASLGFIILVDYILFDKIINLYNVQTSSNDPTRIYSVISFFVVVLINLIIMISFARIKYLNEKKKGFVEEESNPQPQNDLTTSAQSSETLSQ